MRINVKVYNMTLANSCGNGAPSHAHTLTP